MSYVVDDMQNMVNSIEDQYELEKYVYGYISEFNHNTFNNMKIEVDVIKLGEIRFNFITYSKRKIPVVITNVSHVRRIKMKQIFD